MVWTKWVNQPNFNYYFPAGPIYLDEPSPRIGRKIPGNNIKPIVNPIPFPKLLDVKLNAHIKNIKLTYGIRNSSNQYQGLPITSSHTKVPYMGTIAAQPGLPAFWYNNQFPTIGKINKANKSIIWNGPIFKILLFISNYWKIFTIQLF